MKVAELIPPESTLERLHLEAGDVLLLSLHGKTTPDHVSAFVADLSRQLPDGVVTIVVQDGADLASMPFAELKQLYDEAVTAR